MSGHTPGPWHVGEDGCGIYAAGNCVAVGTTHSYHMPGKANARLIAAAPELLAALRALLDLADRNSWQSHAQVLENAAKAIAKAGL